ncbi:DUF4007 family protein [Campylobacter sp. RM12327]|uniref:DUF4007 family protein n=1 Tax=Campylobacter sputorum TaxID=206 RepID=UPI000B78B2AB|nr:MULTISPECIES: DUF4007 family protein [Campylobacter]ASM40155.1 DUF4007 domain protein [Campylobacter sputorum]MBE7358547.1 DUF4007 family protein [Campylobacter sp. RM11302]MBF6669889.1 DUF4007 family protein [Campylobacter sp. RM12327]MBF6675145.1 DUF4007 family protein [Campylobacter sp. RM13538]MBF6676433.1 DUF4007 family protein [Campylobacter sp. RM12321]
MSKFKVSFSGHDKFDCKIDWISRGLEAFSKNSKLFEISEFENSVAKLGLGVNMVKSLRHWMKNLELIDGNDLTYLGKTILENDPYIENTDILWILHWNLVKSKEKSTLYYLFFNKLYLFKFSKEELLNSIIEWLKINKYSLSTNTIKSDIDVFLRMYSSSKESNFGLFKELNILDENRGFYNLNISLATHISDSVFLYILVDYLNSFKNANPSISIDDLQKGEISIQKSLCMNENSFFIKINNLEKITNGKLFYSEASGIRQIYIQEKLELKKILNDILK